MRPPDHAALCSCPACHDAFVELLSGASKAFRHFDRTRQVPPAPAIDDLGIEWPQSDGAICFLDPGNGPMVITGRGDFTDRILKAIMDARTLDELLALRWQSSITAKDRRWARRIGINLDL